MPAWFPTVYESLRPLFAFADPGTVNRAHGRAMLLPFLGLLLGALALRAHRGDRAGLERFGLAATVLGAALSLVGNVTDYWLGEAFSPLVWRLGFALGTALGLLVLAVGSGALGAALWRSRAAPGLASALLVLASPLAVLLTLGGVRYMPVAQALPFCLAWAVLGAGLLSGRVRPGGGAAGSAVAA